MASILDGVNQRTQLVGHNRLELLLFRLDGAQRYGINVFKIREVVACPPLTKMPQSHHTIRGVAHLRGRAVPIVDLQLAVGQSALSDPSRCSVIITEYNRTVQGFLVPHVDHIINKNWEEILLPPPGTGNRHFVTAVTQTDKELIEILDVEKVLYNITGMLAKLASRAGDAASDLDASHCHVLVADDSSVARNQIKRTLERVGVAVTMCRDGREALTMLRHWRDEDDGRLRNLVLVISDVEMPEMDGYTLTAEIRKDPKLASLYVLLHTSLSGVFNSSLLEKVEANNFLSKFDSDELEAVVRERVAAFTSAGKSNC